MNIFNTVSLRTRLRTRLPLYKPDVRQPILEFFLQHSLLSPETWSGGDDPQEPVNTNAILNFGGGHPCPVPLILYRQSKPHYQAHFELQSEFSIEIVRLHSASDNEDLILRLVAAIDNVAALSQPIFGSINALWITERQAIDPWFREETPPELTFLSNDISSSCAFQRRIGVGGLGLRTYLNDNIVKQLGPKVMAKLGDFCVINPCDWGGVRIDLHPALWKAPVEEIIAAWWRTRPILEATGFFCKYVKHPSGRIEWLPAKSKDLYDY